MWVNWERASDRLTVRVTGTKILKSEAVSSEFEPAGMFVSSFPGVGLSSGEGRPERQPGVTERWGLGSPSPVRFTEGGSMC